MQKFTFLVPALLCGLSLSTFAEAQEATGAPPSEADRLFDEAKALAEAGKYAEACPKLERSLQLDSAFGTEFNLADCHEHIGRNASALRHYQNVVERAHIAGKFEREKAARARIDALRSKLGWVRVVPAAGTTLGSVQIDGETMPLPGQDDPGVAVDPGSHKVLAVSTSQRRLETEVAVTPQQTVTLEAFGLSEDERKAADPKRGRTQRIVGYTLGGVGIAGLLAGSGAGLASILIGNSADCGPEQLNGKPLCKDAGDVTNSERAVTAGNISTIAFIAGGAFLVAGAVVLFTAPKPAKSTQSAKVYVDFKGLHF